MRKVTKLSTVKEIDQGWITFNDSWICFHDILERASDGSRWRILLFKYAGCKDEKEYQSIKRMQKEGIIGIDPEDKRSCVKLMCEDLITNSCHPPKIGDQFFIHIRPYIERDYYETRKIHKKE